MTKQSQPVDRNAEFTHRYADIWAVFREGANSDAWPTPAVATVASAGAMYLSCLICIQRTPQMWKALQPARAALRRQPMLSLHPLRFLHITVRMFGVTAGVCTDGCDILDFAGRSVSSQAIEAGLRQCLTDVSPFDIELRGLNSWATGPFVQVFDDGNVARLRRRIAEALPAVVDRDYGDDFVPHMTLGLYRPGADLRAMIDVLQPFRETSFGRFRAHHARLVWGEGGKRKRLTVLASYRLDGSRSEA